MSFLSNQREQCGPAIKWTNIRVKKKDGLNSEQFRVKYSYKMTNQVKYVKVQNNQKEHFGILL